MGKKHKKHKADKAEWRSASTTAYSGKNAGRQREPRLSSSLVAAGGAWEPFAAHEGRKPSFTWVKMLREIFPGLPFSGPGVGTREKAGFLSMRGERGGEQPEREGGSGELRRPSSFLAVIEGAFFRCLWVFRAA